METCMPSNGSFLVAAHLIEEIYLCSMSLIMRRFSARGLIAAAIRLVLPLMLVAGAGTPVFAQASGLDVNDIRIGVHAERTRFVIELSESVEPRVFGLPDPNRIVIDLPEVNFALPEERIGTGSGLIERLRYGLFRPGTSRFVLDLTTTAKVTEQFLMKPDGGKPWR